MKLTVYGLGSLQETITEPGVVDGDNDSSRHSTAVFSQMVTESADQQTIHSVLNVREEGSGVPQQNHNREEEGLNNGIQSRCTFNQCLELKHYINEWVMFSWSRFS